MVGKTPAGIGDAWHDPPISKQNELPTPSMKRSP